VIATPLEFVPLLLVDVPAVPSESKSYFDFCHRPNRDIQIPRELSTTTFGATFCNVCGH